MELTQELVKELFDYRNGELYWKVSRTVRIKVGQIAGSISVTSSGPRRMVHIGQKSVYVSRIVFLWHHGYLPKIVDHEDRNQLNNLIGNLRAATDTQNASNRKSKTGSNSQYLGVHFQVCKRTKILKTTGEMKTYYHSRWIAQLSTNGEKKWIGSFKTEIEAALAFNEAAKIHHGEFANLNIIK